MGNDKPFGKSSISVDEARTLIDAAMPLVGTEEVNLVEALGRVAAASVGALLLSPPFDVSAMDGYAVRTADVLSANTVLRLRGASKAGILEIPRLEPGSCMRIFTGAPIPVGADSVIIQEDARVQGDDIDFTAAAVAGQYVRKAGLNFKPGHEIIPRGRVVTARDIGLLAAGGHASIVVHKRPRIAVLSTGDELAADMSAMSQGRILDANRPGLMAAIQTMGGVPVDLGIAGDSDAAIIDALQKLDADMLVITGGASVGDHDRVRPALQALGFTFDFWTIRMRPGKPLMFGELGGMPVLGMPGNPVSALVCSLLFLKSAVAVMTGRKSDVPELENARLSAPIGRTGGRDEYLRAVLKMEEGSPFVTAFDQQDSSMLALMAQSNCLVVRAAGSPEAQEGETVKIIRFDAVGGF